jgi:hypothetical protein
VYRFIKLVHRVRIGIVLMLIRVSAKAIDVVRPGA